MERDSLARPYAKHFHIGSRKRRSGFSTVVSAAIMIAAVSVLGSVMLIWANSNLKAQQTQIGNYYETNSNLLKETYIIEDVWLSKSPSNYVNVTLRNVGNITITVKQVTVTALNSTGTVACTLSCQSGTSAVKAVTAFNPSGIISGKQTLRIDVGSIDWDHTNSKSLDISVTTARGSMQRIIWKVA